MPEATRCQGKISQNRLSKLLGKLIFKSQPKSGWNQSGSNLIAESNRTPTETLQKSFRNKRQRVVRNLMVLIVWNVKQVCVSKQTILPQAEDSWYFQKMYLLPLERASVSAMSNGAVASELNTIISLRNTKANPKFWSEVNSRIVTRRTLINLAWIENSALI